MQHWLIGIKKALYLFGVMLWVFIGFGSFVSFIGFGMANEKDYKPYVAIAVMVIWGFISYAYQFAQETKKES